MGEELPAEVPCNGHHGQSRGGGGGGDRDRSGDRVLDIYPLSCYYFGSKDSALAAEAGDFRDETPAESVERMKIKFVTLPRLRMFWFLGLQFS